VKTDNPARKLLDKLYSEKITATINHNEYDRQEATTRKRIGEIVLKLEPNEETEPLDADEAEKLRKEQADLQAKADDLAVKRSAARAKHDLFSELIDLAVEAVAK